MSSTSQHYQKKQYVRLQNILASEQQKSMPAKEQKKRKKKQPVKKEMTFVEAESTSGTVDDFGGSASAGADAGIATMNQRSAAYQSPFPAHVTDKLNRDFAKFFLLERDTGDEIVQTPTLVDTQDRSGVADSGLFGSCAQVRVGKHPVTGTVTAVKMVTIPDSNIYLNVHSPFCAVITGVQGSGKSHTMAVMLENCLLPCQLPPSTPMVALRQPLSALVLHYDRVDTNICEATGLAYPSELMEQWIAGAGGAAVGLPNPPAISKIVVLVSPTFYAQRRAFYANDERYDVRPLLFRWASLDAVTLKKLMRIEESGTQLYLSTMLSDLRQYQRDGRLPAFPDFMERMCNREDLSPSQKVPLRQRLEVLKHFVAESNPNQSLLHKQVDLPDLMGAGSLVVADMTDPMLSPSEANGVFQVLLGLYRKKKVHCGKVIVCDEAHKYFDTKNKKEDGLANAIVDTARLMRHEGIRLIISTQSPLTMPPELLELATIQVSHGFHSKDWYEYMSKKVPLPRHGFEVVRRLKTGQALVFSRTPGIPPRFFNLGQDTLLVQVRQRMTQDRGRTLNHQSVRPTKPNQPLLSQHSTYKPPTMPRPRASVTATSKARQLPDAKDAHGVVLDIIRDAGSSLQPQTLEATFLRRFQGCDSPQLEALFRQVVQHLVMKGTLIFEKHGKPALRLAQAPPPEENHAAKEILEPEQQLHEFILDLVRKGGGAMRLSSLGTVFHQRYEKLPERKAVFQRSVQALVDQGKLAREGTGGYLAVHLVQSPSPKHTELTKTEACNLIMTSVRQEGREALLSTIGIPFHKHFKKTFPSLIKRKSLMQTAIEMLINQEMIEQEGESLILINSSESEEPISDDDEAYVL